jgi:hypothetical protein
MNTRTAKGQRRLGPAEHEAAVETARTWLSECMREFSNGDRRGAETDVSDAYKAVKNILDAIVDVPSVYLDLWPKAAKALPRLERLFSFAIQHARHHGRKQSERTTFHERNIILAKIDGGILSYHGAENRTERRKIIREALSRLGHHLDDERIRKGIVAGQQLIISGK